MTDFLSRLGSFTSETGAEITAFDPASQQLFVVSGESTVEVLDLSNPASPSLIASIDLTTVLPTIGGANSVAVSNGQLAIAVEAEEATDPGLILLVDIAAFASNPAGAVQQFTVGSLPDMVTFTPDGSKILVANEGEPDDDYIVDPEGSISIIDVASGAVTTAGFSGFNAQKQALIESGVRIFGPNATVAQDLEPEFIAVSPDGTTAFVTLQENNAFAVVDIANGEVTDILPLGTQDFSQGGGLDASDRDGIINIQNQPVLSFYQPDAIASYEVNGETFYITANEGDARDYDGFSEEVRVEDLTLDPTVYPNAATLQTEENLGRLRTTTVDGDLDGDGDVDQIFGFGGRSFSIWNSNGNQIFDSGSDIATLTAEQFPALFNSQGDADSFDNRSDDKGAEPESVTIGEVDGRSIAFIGLERIGGILAYDVSNPTAPEFINYVRPEDDVAPEGLTFIPAADSPTGENLLVVANEESSTISILNAGSLSNAPSPDSFTLELLHAGDQEGGISALDNAPNFSAILNALRNQDLGNDGAPDNSLTLSSGDAYIPGVFFSASEGAFGGEGRGDILLQNALGFEAIAFGNHEFDAGTETVRDLLLAVEDDPATLDVDESFAGTAFPYLSSNLDFSTDENLADLVVPDGQAPQGNSIAASTVIDVNGERIGVVGATTPTLPVISSPDDVTVLPADFDGVPTDGQLDALAAEIQADVDALLAANPDINKVVLLAHMQQVAIEQELAERLENVDIIVAGGSNALLSDSDDVLRAGDTSDGTYPIIQTGADGNPVAVVNTDGNYRYVGRLVVDFDENGVIIPESYDPTISGVFATDDAGVAAVGGTVDPEVQAIVDELRTVINAPQGNVFGVSNVYLNGVRGSVRTEETNLGNLTADANLAIAQEFDPTVVVSLKNGGGIRDDIGRVIVPAGGTGEAELLPNEEIPGVRPEGGISETDIANSLSFNNGLTLVTVTAEQLLALVEHSVAESEAGNTPGRFPQISGFSFSADLSQPVGERIQSLAIEDASGNDIDVVVQNGEIVGDASRTFRMVTLDFLAGGGDGFPFPSQDDPAANFVELAQGDDAPRTGAATFAVDGSEQDALAEFLATNFTEASPFDAADGSPAEDTRIQNLAFRTDTVIDDNGSGNGGTTPINLDFETADGTALAAGTIITDQFEGVTISTPNNAFGAMLFDSETPTGGDFDLRTSDLGNVLIISEDGDATDPDDNATGGIIRFDWDQPVDLESIGLLDLETPGNRIDLFAADGSLIQSVDVVAAGENQQQNVVLNANNVSRLEAVFEISGAITTINLDDASRGDSSDGSDDLLIGLYDAETNGLIQVLEDGDSLAASNIRDLDDVNIGAIIPNESSLFSQVESMQILLNGVAGTSFFENISPYALFGDTLGDYFPGSLPVGQHTVSFELYSENSGQGELLGIVERNFAIV